MTEPYVRRSDLPYTASQIFALFAEEKNVAFLDSSLENSLGQYAIIGRPRVVLAVDEEAPLFDADLMIGDEADDGVLAKTIF